jgi:hypothetical protein
MSALWVVTWYAVELDRVSAGSNRRLGCAAPLAISVLITPNASLHLHSC